MNIESTRDLKNVKRSSSGNAWDDDAHLMPPSLIREASANIQLQLNRCDIVTRIDGELILQLLQGGRYLSNITSK